MTHNTHDFQIQKNRQVRRVMFEWGADLQKPHMIDHFNMISTRDEMRTLFTPLLLLKTSLIYKVLDTSGEVSRSC